MAVYNKDGALIAAIPLQGDSDGTQFQFSNGTTNGRAYKRSNDARGRFRAFYSGKRYDDRLGYYPNDYRSVNAYTYAG